ncbi:hypothetical protein [Streptomyces sp. NBC_01363]|uniref:DUF6630 family protein n=1 Tax=Streptomyces sp. NBC_01363 TaxID=2903840 RepID=UPI00224CD15E|nr:hypothetical protein [Streptomyces sp. NBC_01363]MCX4733858.1 hypothetical protein [Streptomyces sp. NBC_01363]
MVEHVLHARDTPKSYVRTHAGGLADRGIDEPIADLAWMALVDALYNHRLLAEFDLKEDRRRSGPS